MKSLVSVSFLLLLMAGCQNQQSQMNPFAVYGPQRLPPPGTQTYGQPAQTAPYYQGPAATQAPTIQGGYQTNPPAQFTPPPNTAPTMQQPPSSYGSQQWRSVSESSPSSSSPSGSVVPASYTEEVNMSTSAGTPTTTNSTTAASSTSTSTSTNPYVRGMHVNEVTEVVPVQSAPSTTLAPPATSTVPNPGWSIPQASGSTTNGSISPSRIP